MSQGKPGLGHITLLGTSFCYIPMIRDHQGTGEGQGRVSSIPNLDEHPMRFLKGMYTIEHSRSQGQLRSTF